MQWKNKIHIKSLNENEKNNNISNKTNTERLHRKLDFKNFNMKVKAKTFTNTSLQIHHYAWL